MRAHFERLSALSSRAGKFLIAGTLAASLTPAMALAANSDALEAGAQAGVLSAQHYDPINNSGKVVIPADNTDPLSPDPKGEHNVELLSAKDNVYQYRGYVHTDGSHFKGYTLYTTITTDDEGIVTGIDITSGNDTFAGKWGYETSVIEGYLPDGVTFSSEENKDGTYAVAVSNADVYKPTLASVSFISTNATGSADALGVDQNASGKRQVQSGRSKVTAPNNAEVALSKFDAGKLAAPEKAEIVTKDSKDLTEVEFSGDYADYFNLIKCTYSFGYDKNQFNAYVPIGKNAKAAEDYIDFIGETSWSETPESGYTTNREGWTGIMATVMLRELNSWGATMAEGYKAPADALEGEIEGIDTVSGATKTAIPFVKSLTEARQAGYIKGVAEDVKLTIDGANAADAKSMPRIEANDNTSETLGSQDRTTVVANGDGTYTVSVDVKRYGGGRLSLDNIFLYNLSGKTVGTQGMMQLAKQSSPADGADFNEADFVYTPLKLYRGELTKGRGGQESYGSLVSYNQEADNKVLFDDEFMKFTYSNSGGQANINAMPATLVTKDKNITHVVLKYTLGHGSFAIAYDLANMVKVPDVTKLLQAVDSSKPETVSAAREAYDALPYDVRPFTTGIDKLVAAEKAVSEADLANATVTVADATYTGKALKPAVTVVSKNGTELKKGTDFTVSYKNNKKAGKASVTVTGKGAYTGTQQASFTIAKAKQTIKAAKTYTVKKSALKKKAQKISVKFKANGGGKITYKAAKSGKVSIAKNGKVTVKKGAKGTTTLKVKVTAAAKGSYAKTTQTVKLKIKVK